MSRLRVHVVHEFGPDLRPYGTAIIRLIRPLSHPLLRPHIDASFGHDYDGAPVDAVIFDRICHPHRLSDVQQYVGRARRAGAAVLHAVDDNFVDLEVESPGTLTGSALGIWRFLTAEADGLIVSTAALGRRLEGLNRQIEVVPNALDERLIAPPVRVGRASPTFRRTRTSGTPPARVGRAPEAGAHPAGSPEHDRASAPDRQPAGQRQLPSAAKRLVIGYMGTFTHQADLRLAWPALRQVAARHPGMLELQLLGVAASVDGELDPTAMVVRQISRQDLAVYHDFLPWFTAGLGWDIAIAPLVDSPFTRTKSDIKFLDYAAAAVPGIFSAVPAYDQTVRHLENGWLAPNHSDAWNEALEALLGDPALRNRLAKAAHSAVMGHRTLAQCAPRWHEAIKRIMEGAPGAASLTSPPEASNASAPQSSAGPSAAPSAGSARRPSAPPPAARSAASLAPPAGRDAEDAASPAGAPRRLHVLLEYGDDALPLASAELRLVRPLRHPAFGRRFDVTFGPTFNGHNVDAVIVDRLWRPDISPQLAARLVCDIKDVGARLILSLDDNLFDLADERADWPAPRHLEALTRLLGEADGVLASTAALADRLSGLTARIEVVPNALDERLLGAPRRPAMDEPMSARPVTIGYMGTATHDDDLLLVLPALEALRRRYGRRIRIEIVGGVSRADLRRQIAPLAVRWTRPPTDVVDYPAFMAWFTHAADWDIALAPLRDTPFTRCKSDLKYLDYSAIGAAGVFSRVRPYAASVQDGETGLLVDNTPDAWLAALGRLIEDSALRQRLAVNGATYLHRERVLRRRAPDFDRAIERLVG